MHDYSAVCVWWCQNAFVNKLLEAASMTLTARQVHITRAINKRYLDGEGRADERGWMGNDKVFLLIYKCSAAAHKIGFDFNLWFWLNKQSLYN